MNGKISKLLYLVILSNIFKKATCQPCYNMDTKYCCCKMYQQPFDQWKETTKTKQQNENAKTELKMLICNLKQRSRVNFINVLQAAIVLVDAYLTGAQYIAYIVKVEHIFFLSKLVKLDLILLVKLNNYQRICTIWLVKLTVGRT